MGKQTSKPRLQIIRGLPGSGKTTLALQRYPHLMRIETDMFFSRQGKYIFTNKLNEEAVLWFEDMVFNCAYAKMDFVVTGVFAANTERFDRVIRTARDFGYEIHVKTLANDYGNIHNVPKKTLDSMRAAFVNDIELAKRYSRYKNVHFNSLMEGIKGNKPFIGI